MRYFLGMILIAALIGGIYQANLHFQGQVNQSKLYIKPSRLLREISFGYHEPMADSLWIRTVQDLGICLQKRAPPGEPRTGLNRIHDCSKGWNYHMMDVITHLVARYQIVYTKGVMGLTVIADDVDGASLIYEKGTDVFPDNWEYNYRAGTHFMVEVGDKEKAGFYLARAAKNGAPGWAMSLAARLYTEAGQALMAKSLLEQFISENSDNRWLSKAQYRLEEINKKLTVLKKSSTKNSQ